MLVFALFVMRDGNMKTTDKANMSITRVESPEIGLKETDSNKACTREIRKKSYELVRFLRSYKVQWVEYGQGRDKSEEEVKYRTTNSSSVDLTVEISKLSLCVSPINLVFIFHLEDHHFQSGRFFEFWFLIFKTKMRYENGQKCLNSLRTLDT